MNGALFPNHPSHRNLALIARALTLCVVVAGVAEAQIIKVPRRAAEPAVWASLSFGAFQSQDIADGTTQSYWQFGGTTGWQWRGTLEKSVGRASAIGVMGSLVRMGFTWNDIASDPIAGAPEPDARCGRCDAHMQVATVAGTFHAGGGLGLHQVIDVSLGATRYGNFSADDNDQKLAPTKGDIDGNFTIGYGIGYTVRPTLHVGLVQEYSFVMHQRENLPRDATTFINQRVTRLFVRAGMGHRKTHL